MHPLINTALTAAREAGEYIIRAADKLPDITIENKGPNDFVTEIDRNAEYIVIKHIKKRYPEHSFLGEEGGLQEGSGDGADYVWVIDPIDGTTNYIHGIPQYAVSVGLKVKGQYEAAVIVDPFKREEFTAYRGKGAHLNGRRIRVSNRKQLDNAVLGTGIPFTAPQDKHMDAYLEMLKAFALNTAGIRRAGAASLDLAYVAAGRLDGFWEIGLKEWDMAAGVLLVKEAGGLVSDFAGGSKFFDSGNIVCANPKLFKLMLQTMRPHLNHKALLT